MTYERKWEHQTDTYKRISNKEDNVKNIYWGTVISLGDTTDGGRIKVRIGDLDNKIPDENIPDAYPLLPKFFWQIPQKGEAVRIIIEDPKHPQRSRYWTGSIISQPHKINFDGIRTALSTTNFALTRPEPAPSSIPEAKGVYPDERDIALVGRDNTDIILRKREVEIRAGKHEIDNNLKLNRLNPASVKLTFEDISGTTVSTNVMMADRIALISHDGNPKFKGAQLDVIDRDKIFKEAHPLGRADVIVEALEILRKAIIQHIHPYSGMPADKSGIVIDLEKIDFNAIIQKNIRIN